MSHQAADPAPRPRSTRRTAIWGARAISYVVYAYVVVVEIILAMGFVLLLFGANPDPPFVRWVYRSMDRAMEPFRGIFTPVDLGSSGGNEVESVLDTSVLFAMIVYGIGAWAVHALIEWLTYRMALLDRQAAEQAWIARQAPSSPPLGTASPAVQPTPPPSAGDAGPADYPRTL